MELTSSILRSTLAAGPVLDQLQRRLTAVVRGALSARPRCLVIGHDDEVSRARHRLFLRCTHCGRETAGWVIGPERHAGPATRVARARTPWADTWADIEHRGVRVRVPRRLWPGSSRR
jgi:hypothetical protein